LSVLTEATSVELVVPITPTTVHRVVERLSENVWYVRGWSAQFSSAFAAMQEIRNDVEQTARHPVRIQIQWKAVDAKFIPPTTGTTL
jgi:predicted phosphoribosyltransferase